MRVLSSSRHIALISLWYIAICLGSEHAWGQTDSISMYQLQISRDLPLDQSLQGAAPVFFSANRRLDSLKHVALPINVLTKERLAQSGASNIPEALQLFPEFLVKTKANGLYEVAYRGAKNNLRSAQQGSGQESLMLIINAIPFNDALSGEIWWEAIPVSVEDIERIELIRSPQGTWYGYGGGLGIINIVTKKSKNTIGTQLNANLQAGQFQSYDYHGSLNIGVNEQLSLRVGGHYQARQRFQDDYFVRSASRYVSSDSLLFYQPEAFQTHLYTGLSLQSSGFDLNAAYQWNDSVYLSVDLGNRNSKAQSIFSPADEILSTTRASQNLWVNIHFSSPTWNAYLFHRSGNKDYATGYTGLQYQTARTGARLEYNKKVGRYGLLLGTEFTKDDYSPQNDGLASIPLLDSVKSIGQWSQLLASLYFQQTANFYAGRLYLESGQRIFQSLQGLDFPLGYHFALKWVLTKSTFLHASTGQTIQTTQQLFEYAYQRQPVKIISYELGIQQQFSASAVVKASVFNQQIVQNKLSDQRQQEIPEWGATLESGYQINRWTVNAHVSRFFTADFSDQQQASPAWIGTISGNFSTFFDRINLNGSLSYYSEHAELVSDGYYEVSAQWLVNTKCSYKIWKQNAVYVNVRNLTNEQTITVPFADRNSRLIMLGLNIAL